jgi:entericidin B
MEPLVGTKARRTSFLSAVTPDVPLRETQLMKLGKLTAIALLVGTLTAVGCANTVRGVGRDAANTVNATQGAVKGVANAAQ